MTTYLWPRLPSVEAERLLAQLRDHEPARAGELARTEHDRAEPSATGGQIVPPSVVAAVADRVREVARETGYPTALGRARVSNFDVPCGAALVDTMDIIPGDAASEGVWSFVTLVLLPDIAVWRFPDRAENRMLGRPRNVFRRLWWRDFVLAGENAPSAYEHAPLGEDELVNIFERPRISRTPELARAMTRAVRTLQQARGVPRSEIMRDLAKRVLRLTSLICFDALGPEAVDRLVMDRMRDAVRALTDERPAVVPAAAEQRPSH